MGKSFLDSAAQSINEETKTVTIRQREFVLKTGTFLPGYHHVIFAATVRVMKSYKNAGCDLTIYAARLLIEDKEAGGKIDVSGKNGAKPPSRKDRNAIGLKTGTHDGGDGKNGQDGEQGGRAGNITIYAGSIDNGKLEIVGGGGNGGGAQDGGHAKKGNKPDPQGVVPHPKKIVVGTTPVINDRGIRIGVENIYGWGSDVKKLGSAGLSAFLLVSKNTKPGKRGGHGGNAGLPGRPGDGGAGAAVAIHSLRKSQLKIKTALNGGDAGGVAEAGTPGAAAKGGLGGEYLYKTKLTFIEIDWSTRDSNSGWKKHWKGTPHFTNLGVTQNVITVDGKKTLRQRAQEGGKGKDGGYGPTGKKAKPAAPKASKGGNGKAQQFVLSDSNVLRDVPHAYRLLLQRSAAVELANRSEQAAKEILLWLLFLTEPFRDVAKDACDDALQSQQMYREAQNSLLTIGRRDDLQRPKRFIYKDIEKYVDFVETSLTHVQEQSDNFYSYQTEYEDKKKSKVNLKNAIANTNRHIEHLIGSATVPGSIVYFKETEDALKLELQGLDLQLGNYKDRLEKMPTALQNEIDTEYFKKTQISFWDLLEFFSMAAGVVINFASAGSSLLNMVGKVKDFYKEALELSTWSEIIKDGIWTREFSELKKELGELLKSDEFKALSKDAQSFVKSTTDFQAKIAAYQELLESRKDIDFKLDLYDVQASILIFDIAKLRLKKQRTELESNLRSLLDDYAAARDWEHVFTDFFDTSIARFDMLAHLAEVQADRRQLEYQRDLQERNVADLQAQLNRLKLNTLDTDFDDALSSLEANLYLALNQSLERIIDENRAYRIWTLNEHKFPEIKSGLSVKVLRDNFHKPLWGFIKTGLSATVPPTKGSNYSFSDSTLPVWFTPAKFKAQYFDVQKQQWRFSITLPVNVDSNQYFKRLIQPRIFLKGAATEGGSPFHYFLRHNGISRYLNNQRKVLTAYQIPRSIESSYKVIDGEAVYDYQGAITTQFHDSNWLTQLRYSPYATWELVVIPNFQEDGAGIIYNHNIDFSGLEKIELSYSAFRESFDST